MLFKLYEGNSPLYFDSIAALADFCEVSREDARKAYYKRVTTLNGREVINVKI